MANTIILCLTIDLARDKQVWISLPQYLDSILSKQNGLWEPFMGILSCRGGISDFDVHGYTY